MIFCPWPGYPPTVTYISFVADQSIHRNLGMACTILGAAQFSAIVIRPAKHHKCRRAWELCHHWVGRAVSEARNVCAIVCIQKGVC